MNNFSFGKIVAAKINGIEGSYNTLDRVYSGLNYPILLIKLQCYLLMCLDTESVPEPVYTDIKNGSVC